MVDYAHLLFLSVHLTLDAKLLKIVFVLNAHKNGFLTAKMFVFQYLINARPLINLVTV